MQAPPPTHQQRQQQQHQSVPVGASAQQSHGPTASPFKSLDTVVVWFRRDLRLDDNPALVAATQAARSVVPVFIWAPEEEGQFQPGRCSRWWLKQTLRQFQGQLRAVGSRLILGRSEDSTKALLQIVQETGAQALFFNHLYDPISLVRDHEMKQALSSIGVICRSYNADLLYEPWETLDDKEQSFTSFKDYWNKVLQMPYQPPFPLPPPSSLPAVKSSITSLNLEDIDFFMTPEQEASSEQLKFRWKPGVEGAIEKLEAFLQHQLIDFQHDRAKVDRDSTSQLSPWIHCGTLSVRYIYYRVRQKQSEWMTLRDDRSSSCHDFLQQIGYREYSRYLSFHFPFIHERALLAHLRACPWRIDYAAFKAWKQGMTGYPLVDSAMKQLWSTGWLHNRLRVVVASFMVKNLLLPWQWGLKHYWDTLLDADLECDALGWQYVSGCLADAHPFNHMLNLREESKRFDPEGEYVRRWLPVLASLPTEYIHEPWRAPKELLEAADVELGYNYPYPIISEEESQKNIDNANVVIQECTSGSSKSMRHPYRVATDPTRNGIQSMEPLSGTHQVSNQPVPSYVSFGKDKFCDKCCSEMPSSFVRNAQGQTSISMDGERGGAGEEENEQRGNEDENSEEVFSNATEVSGLMGCTSWTDNSSRPGQDGGAIRAASDRYGQSAMPSHESRGEAQSFDESTKDKMTAFDGYPSAGSKRQRSQNG